MVVLGWMCANLTAEEDRVFFTVQLLFLCLATHVVFCCTQFGAGQLVSNTAQPVCLPSSPGEDALLLPPDAFLPFFLQRSGRDTH